MGNKRNVTVGVDPQRKKIWVVWALVCAAAMLLMGVSALAFAFGYARGSSQIPSNIVSIQGSAQAEADLPPPNELENLPAEEEKENAPKIRFEAKNEAHMKDVENVSRRMVDTIENFRPPESMTQELMDFLNFEILFGPSRFGDKEFPIDDELIRYRLNFCRAGDFIENRYGDSAYWSVVMRRCLPPNNGYRGVSPAFSLHWSKPGCEDRDYKFSEHFSDAMCINLQEIQFEGIEALRQFLSNPDRLWHIFNLKEENLKTFLDKLSPEDKTLIASRITSAIASADTVLNNCTETLCAIPGADYSVSEEPLDTVHFVRVSPIKDVIDYDMLLASEIYEVEFFVRRYDEGGTALVTAYRDILQEVADMAAEQPQ